MLFVGVMIAVMALFFSKSRNRVVVVLSNVIAYDAEETAYTDLLGYRFLLEDEKKFS